MEITFRMLVHDLGVRYGSENVLKGETGMRSFCEDVRLVDGVPPQPGFLYVADADARGEEVSRSPAGKWIVLEVGQHPSLDQVDVALRTDRPFSEVFTFLQQALLRYRTWLQRMDASIIGNEGLQALFDLSEEFLINNVIVVDPALKLLAYTKGIACDDPVTVELIKHGYHTEENIRKFSLNQRFEPWATQNGFIINSSKTICAYTTAVFSFKAAGSFSLIVVMMCNNAQPEPWLLDTFMAFLNRVAFYSMRDYASGTPSGSAFNAFVQDLLEKRLAPDEIEQRRRYLGIPEDGPFCLFDIDIRDAQRLATRIVVDVARSTAPAKAMVHGSSVIVLCFCCHGSACARECITKHCAAQHSTVTQRVQAILDEYGLYAGRSARFDRIDLLFNAREQARAALEAGRVYREAHAPGQGAPSGADGAGAPSEAGTVPVVSAEYPRIFSFDDCYLGYLVNSAAERGTEFFSTLHFCNVLRDIKAYDAKHGTDNYTFLWHYLTLERRTTLVADALHMHRNNVKYRADRLEKLFDVDTEDIRQRRELMTAYRILAFLRR